MNIYTISRTRLVTERFRVTAETEEDAYDAIGCESSDVEKIEESTLQSDSTTDDIEEEK